MDYNNRFMKYINAEKLKAEIERLKEETSIGICEYDEGQENGRMEVLTSLQSTIDSLQQEQPKVDLEKEIQEYLEKLGGGHGGFVDDLTDDDLTRNETKTWKSLRKVLSQNSIK